MSHRKTILAILGLGAACLIALAASNASATMLHECKKEVGVGTGHRYSSAACTTRSGTGEYETVPISGSQTVIPTLTSEKATFSGTVAEVAFSFACTGATSANSKAENVGSEPSASVKGTGKTIFLGCVVTKPAAVGCAIPETLETAELKAVTTGLTTTFEPASGTKVLTVEFSGCTGAASSLNGAQIVEGSLSAITTQGNPATQEFTKTSGSKLVISEVETTFEAGVHYKTSNGALLGLRTPQVTLHECGKAAEGTGVRYSDAACGTESGGGEFETSPISGSQTVVPKLTSETAVLSTAFAGTRFETACTGVTSANSKLENTAEGESMGVKGSGTIELTGCKWIGPVSGCKVPETIKAAGLSTSTTDSFLVLANVNISVTVSGCELTPLNGVKVTKGTLTAITKESTPSSQEFTSTSSAPLTLSGMFIAVIHFQTENGTKLGLETP